MEPDESFALSLSLDATNSAAVVGRGEATGTITSDDMTTTVTPCWPRPDPTTQVAQIGTGRLQVTVSARSTAALPGNVLHSLQFGTAENARVEIPGAAPERPAALHSRPAARPGRLAASPSH